MKTMSGAGRIHHSSGFTLIEIMIAVAIVGILAAIAYPNYTAYVERGKRSDGRALLLEAASRMERYYSDCNKYPGRVGSATSCPDPSDPSDTGMINLSTSSEGDYYNLALTGVSGQQQEYILEASPNNWTDSDCGDLTLKNNGIRSRSGAGKTEEECWSK